MTLSTKVKIAAAGLAALVAAALSHAAAAESPRVRWKMHSSWAGNVDILGAAGKRFEKSLKEATEGRFEIRFFDPGALLPGINYADAVAQGSIDAAWGTPGYVVGKVPALAFYASVPFGPGPGEYLAWLRNGGGLDIYEDIYKGIGLKGVFCMMTGPEASGWFRQPVQSLDQLRGMKVRYAALGARVMEKFGVSTQLLAGGDVYPALELGTIDATEMGMPSLDESYGIYQVAKHYYFPGWHQPTTIFDIAMHPPRYDELPQSYKAALQTVCDASILQTYIDGEAKQAASLKRMQAKGVTLHKWTPEQLKQYEAAWLEVATEEAAKDPVFKRVWDSYRAFRAEYAVWTDYGYMK